MGVGYVQGTLSDVAEDRTRCVVECTILGLAVAVAYANAFAAIFQFDDYRAIVDNPAVHSWSAWFADLSRGGIRPFLKLTYLANYKAGGLFGFHLVNTGLHLCNTLLVYRLTHLLCASTPESTFSRRFVPIITALLFAVHPMQVESVTYITGRSSSLASFFCLASLLCYVRGCATGRALLTHAAGPILFFFAFATKETSICLPVGILLFDAAARKEIPLARRISGLGVYWLLASAFVAASIAHPGYRGLLAQSISSTHFYEPLLTQIHGVCRLLSHAVIPLSLNIDPEFQAVHGLSFVTAIEVVLMGAALCFGLVALRRDSGVGFGILWFLVHSLAVYIVAARMDVMNERHLYLGGWGLFLLFGILLVRLSATRRARTKLLLVSACCIALCLAGGTLVRNRVYENEVALWQDTVKKSPNKARVHNNLGYAYYLSGDLEKARRHYAIALRLSPRSITTLNNLLLLEGFAEKQPHGNLFHE